MAASLTSDHVNYLIWRYLQEQGYGKAAVQLSRDWRTSDPQALPFTDSVKPAYLIQILQDGLAYDQLLVAARQTQDRSTGGAGNAEDGRTQDLAPPGKRYSFVDVKKRRLSQRSDDGAPTKEIEAPRKRPRLDQRPSTAQQTPGRRKSSKGVGLSVQTQPSPKKIEQSKAVEEEPVLRVQDVVEEPEEMDESPVPEEPPLVPTLEIGASTGMQSERIIDKTIVKSTATLVIPNADIYTILPQNKHPSKLTAIGGSTWHTLSLESPSTTHDPDPMETEASNDPASAASAPASLLSLTSSSHFLTGGATRIPKFAVSHFAYAPTSTITARAIEELWGENDATGVIALDLEEETLELARPVSSVLSLRFDPTSRYLLAAWHSGIEEDSILRVWDVTRPDDEPPKVFAKGMIRDSTWLNGESFVVCGEGWLQFFSVKTEGEGDEQQLVLSLTKHLASSHGWESMVYEPATNSLACMSGTNGALGVVDAGANELKMKSDAHSDMATAIQWQPRRGAGQEGHSNPTPATEPASTETMNTDKPELDITTRSEPSSPRPNEKYLLASSSADGTVKLWNTEGTDIECVFQYAMEPKGMPAWAMALSPNGDYVAAAGEGVVLVWLSAGKRELVARWYVQAEQAPAATRAAVESETGPAVAKQVISADHDRDAEMTDGPPLTAPPTQKPSEGFARSADGADAVASPTRSQSAGKVDHAMSETSSAALAPLHSLMWSSDSKRLVHALGSLVSVLDFPLALAV